LRSQGCASLRSSRPYGGNLTELVEPCGALPRKCLFVYVFTSSPAGFVTSPRNLQHQTLTGGLQWRFGDTIMTSAETAVFKKRRNLEEVALLMDCSPVIISQAYGGSMKDRNDVGVEPQDGSPLGERGTQTDDPSRGHQSGPRPRNSDG
jgi:hypothetical protein